MISRSSSGCLRCSLFQSSVLVEKFKGNSPTEDITFFKAIEELGEIAKTHTSQRKIKEELDNSANNNLLEKQN